VIWLFVLGTKEILANPLTAEKFVRTQILAPLCKELEIQKKVKDKGYTLSETLPLPNFDQLRICLSQTQRNNGS
jgi:hypothetical protein